jgi:glycosyltransferase involved in cell wall biosynthesis
MSKLTYFVGGSVGADPRSPKTWSGISAFVLKAMEEANMLDRAVGLEIPRLTKTFLMARNFNRSRAVWRSQFYFDPAYRRALTKAAERFPAASPFLFQIGHQFSLPDAFPQKKCISYHDGNLPELLRSGFGFAGVARQRIDQALRYEEQTARQMTAVFTFSEYLRQSFISDYHVPAERVVNVGAGINLAEIPEMNAEKDYSAPRILFIGIEFVRKGGPQLLDAFQAVRKSIPAAELHIVGPASLDNVPPGVVFHGRLSKADPEQKQKLESLFRDSSIFVLPSLYEPFGIAPLEAMLYQLPCVVTDDWALRESVSPGFNGELVVKGATDDLAQKIIQLLSNPDLLALMGRQGRERVLHTYTWPTVVGRMATALHGL